MTPELKVTTALLWRATLIFALIDAGFVPLLARRIKPERLRQLKWTLAATMVIFWSALWTWVFYSFWESVYHYFFPEWARWLLPPVYGLLFAAVGLVFWWLALRLPGNAVATFCLLGGLWGMITHIWAVTRGLVDKPPMLQGVDPVAAVVIAGFEFMFYWCIMLSIASLMQRGWKWSKDMRHGWA
jgi:hypothetical protein